MRQLLQNLIGNAIKYTPSEGQVVVQLVRETDQAVLTVSDNGTGIAPAEQTRVVDRFHRSHDISNLFICDGSSFVTSGRGQPTMTIMALAFRAAEHIARAARANDV